MFFGCAWCGIFSMSESWGDEERIPVWKNCIARSWSLNIRPTTSAVSLKYDLHLLFRMAWPRKAYLLENIVFYCIWFWKIYIFFYLKYVQTQVSSYTDHRKLLVFLRIVYCCRSQVSKAKVSLARASVNQREFKPHVVSLYSPFHHLLIFLLIYKGNESLGIFTA